MPVSPFGYMTCGTYQYALVPVPMQQYSNGMSYAVSPTYSDAIQAKSFGMDQSQQLQPQQQQWGPYEDHQNGYCMVSPVYQNEQSWPSTYDVSAPMSPCAGSTDVAPQWW
jgi:hypothetical protein